MMVGSLELVDKLRQTVEIANCPENLYWSDSA